MYSLESMHSFQWCIAPCAGIMVDIGWTGTRTRSKDMMGLVLILPTTCRKQLLPCADLVVTDGVVAAPACCVSCCRQVLMTLLVPLAWLLATLRAVWRGCWDR